MRKIIAFIIIVVQTIWVFSASKLSFTANAPETVVVGDQFRLTYTISTQDVRDFKFPSISGFEVLSGPNRKLENVTQNVNGKQTSYSSITYTFILMANKDGKFTIPAASIKAAGEQLISNPVSITVLKSNAQAPSDRQSSSANQENSLDKISNSDLFILGNVNKTKVYEQEAILLTYKIYSSVNLRGFDNVKIPDFKGFQSQEVDFPDDRKWGLEHYNGKNYRTTIYRQFILFPQQIGRLTISGARFDASVLSSSQTSVDPFDMFFNGGTSIKELKKVIYTPNLTIDVVSLPAGRPNDFSGGVGVYDIKSSISNTEIKANEPVTIKLTISGTGNSKLLSIPKIKFPTEFEVYDPKIDNHFAISKNGLTGEQVIEYLAIPRTEGEYKIPGTQFSFFEINSKTYKTVKTDDFVLKVSKGEMTANQSISNYTQKQDLEIINEDIRFIKQGPVKLLSNGKVFFGSFNYYLCYVILILLFFFSLFIYRYKKSIDSNSTLRANRVAVKRLKSTKKLLDSNDHDHFYDEILKAMNGYIIDKFKLPQSMLSKETIDSLLRSHHVEESLISDFIDHLSKCEFARFAPDRDVHQEMDQFYNSSIALLIKMENSIKLN